jgi:dihydrolipoamide dehydrogenase
MDETDLAVVGGGPGGYAAAIRAGQLGLDVTLVDSDGADGLGGACLHRGCIPSKALLSATGVAHRAATATEMGVHADPTVDTAETRAWTDGVVDRLAGGVERLCGRAGVDVRAGTARFADEHTLAVEGEDAGELAFERAVVATGSRPVELPGLSFDTPGVWASRDALSLDTVPDSLVVVGAGYVGLELATVYARLGTDVAVVEALDRPLPGFETDLARYVRRSLADEGVDFHFGQAATGHRATDDGVAVLAESDDGERAFVGDRVLVAVGREPVTETVAPANAGLDPGDDGFLATDERCRTGRDHVYAVGDVAGEPMLAHKATVEGVVAAADAGGGDASVADRAIPAAVFTDPEVATVGHTEAEAETAGHDPAVGEFRLGASGRALTENRPLGLARVVADADTGRVLGGQVVGPHASEVVAQVALAVETGATVAELGRTVQAHPTLSEAVSEAAESVLGRAIHT